MSAKRKYPWDDWFGQPITVLVRGEDYHCSQSTMVQTIRNNASRRGLRVRVVEDDDCRAIRLEVLGEVQHTDRATVAN